MIGGSHYQATVEGFRKYLQLTTERAVNLIKLGVRLAREACREVPGTGEFWGGGGSKNSITRYHIQCLREYIRVFIHASSFCCVYALFKDVVHLRYIIVRTMIKLLMKVEVTCNCISCYCCTVQYNRMY